ncbi:alpha-ketoglutarate-dependent dioxygenase AlkB family protein [Flavisericum labens]|uniref:alpha-ketoglutarate-dependent dioxygenase AlkB family protein n=1 Tax=Flavisericum labens TaxID=3377112 RepID=UPI00387AFDF9
MRLTSEINLNLKDGDAYYYHKFFNKPEADTFLKNLLTEIKWKQDNINIFGKTYPQPRLTAFFANNNQPYSYSNIKMKPKDFMGDLLTIKQILETEMDIKFTSCLANLYRDGQDSNGWHADNEKELGINPIIASISFGAERLFHLKHKKDNTLRTRIILEHGSLLIMKGATQHNWLHQIPKTKKDIEQRINLTFRIIA